MINNGRRINPAATFMAAALAATMLNPAIIANIKIPKEKSGRPFPKNLKMSFDNNLPKIAIEKVDVELILAELKPEHSTVINKIYDYYKTYDQDEQINEFISWSNEFLAQLLFSGSLHCIEIIENTISQFEDNPRYRSIINDLHTLKDSIKYFSRSKILILLSAEESSNSYPISKTGGTFIKEFSTLESKFSTAMAKVAQFQKTQK